MRSDGSHSRIGVRSTSWALRPALSRRSAPGPTPIHQPEMVSMLPIVLAGVGLSALIAALVLTASGDADQAGGLIALHMLVIAAPVATGLYALRSPRTRHFGRLLIVAA